MGYLICEKCGGYYELQDEENPEDFKSCECGGNLNYVEEINKIPESKENKKLVCLKCGAKNVEDAVFCKKCGNKLNKEPIHLTKKLNKIGFLLIGIVICASVGIIYFSSLDPTYDDGNISFSYPKGYELEKWSNMGYITVKGNNGPFNSFEVEKVPMKEGVSFNKFIFDYIDMQKKYGTISNEDDIIVDETAGYEFDYESGPDGLLVHEVLLEKNGNLYFLTLFYKKLEDIDDRYERQDFIEYKTYFKNTVISTFQVK